MTFHDIYTKFKCFFDIALHYKSFVLYVHPIKALSETKMTYGLSNIVELKRRKCNIASFQILKQKINIAYKY